MEVAKKLARGLVERQLAACVNIMPGITSIYAWEGKLEEESELLLMVREPAISSRAVPACCNPLLSGPTVSSND